jgi:hypothetical protein
MGVLLPSADRAAATYTKEFGLQQGKRGILLSVNYTAGTGSVVFTVEYRDSAEAAWDTLPGATMAAIATVQEQELLIYPGVVVNAGRSINSAVPKALRLKAVLSTANATFSAAVDYLD